MALVDDGGIVLIFDLLTCSDWFQLVILIQIKCALHILILVNLHSAFFVDIIDICTLNRIWKDAASILVFALVKVQWVQGQI